MTSNKDNLVFEKTSFLQGINSPFIKELYLKYLKNPEAIPESWREFFDGLDEDQEIVNLMEGYNAKLFGDKKLLSKIEFIPLDDEGNKTVIEYKTWEFDVEIPSNYFTTQYVSRLK